MFRFLASSCLALSLTPFANAAPMLRLVKTAVGPASIAVGSSGPAQVVEAYNAGDGALSLTVASSAPWAVAAVGAARPCTSTNQVAVPCIPISVALNTASLAAGMQTAILTVTGDSTTVDAPQTITVTVAMGGAVPSSIVAYVPPNGSVDVSTPTNSNLNSHATTLDGNNWLSMIVSGGGSFQFVYPWYVHIAAQPANVPGTYTGSMTLSNSTFAGDNKTIPVTMNVTTQPIAQAPAPVNVRLAQGAPPMSSPFVGIALTNLGLGALTVTGVSTSIASCGNSWLTVFQNPAGAALTFDPTGQPVGTCSATLTFATNAANTLAPVPVTMQVVAKGQPLINYQGVTDNVTFAPGSAVSPGDIVVVKGEQFSFASTSNGVAVTSQVPWPTSLGGVGVTVNGEAAPLYYTFYGQIAFEMPMDIPLGTALVKVTSNGVASNPASVPVVARAPAIDVITDYNNNGSVPSAAAPAHIGDTLILWSFGLGPTSPAAVTGQPPPYPPLASLIATPTVAFSSGGGIVAPVDAAPGFAGLSPQYPTLYQVNVAIPQGCPTGTVNVRLGFPDGTFSNTVAITVQ
jgi:uncharacterized protein (TIGR03437 family)